MSGTIIHGSRKLKRHERLFLLKHVGLAAAGILALLVLVAALGVWAVTQDDPGGRYLLVLLTPPALLAIRWLWRWATPYRRDLFDNKVESVIGRIGALDLQPGIVPVHLGERIFDVQTALLARKRVDEPILVEFISHSGLAVAIDGKPNLV